MLKAEDIINGLQAIVNEYSTIAIIWHVIFYALIIALIAKWQPSNRLLGILLCIPLLSVAVLAWITGNPFNGIMFSILSILVIIFGLKTSTQPISMSQLVFVIIGILMVAFGLVYPHFIDKSIIKHLYASPVGLIPCPTLCILIGFVLIFNGFGSQAIKLIFIIFGLFYGIFGVLKLAVYVDMFLIIGTITLLIKYIMSLRTS